MSPNFITSKTKIFWTINIENILKQSTRNSLRCKFPVETEWLLIKDWRQQSESEVIPLGIRQALSAALQASQDVLILPCGELEQSNSYSLSSDTRRDCLISDNVYLILHQWTWVPLQVMFDSPCPLPSPRPLAHTFITVDGWILQK